MGSGIPWSPRGSGFTSSLARLGQLEGKAGVFQKKHVRIMAVSLDNLEDSKATQAKFPHLLVVADFDKKLSEAVQVVNGNANAPTTILVDGQGVFAGCSGRTRF